MPTWASAAKTLLEAFDYHNQRMKALVGKEYAPATYQRYLTTRDHVARFLQHQYQQEDLLLSEVDLALGNHFDYYFRVLRHCNNTTSVKCLKNLHKILLMSLENGWIQQDPFAHYKGKSRVKDQVYLDQEELSRIQHKELGNERLAVIRASMGVGR